MNRNLYLIAYDISDPGRLTRVRYLLKSYSTGGQKSVYECFLTAGEAISIQRDLQEIINEEQDRVHIFPMDGRSRTHTLGIAVQPHDPEYFYIG